MAKTIMSMLEKLNVLEKNKSLTPVDHSDKEPENKVEGTAFLQDNSYAEEARDVNDRKASSLSDSSLGNYSMVEKSDLKYEKNFTVKEVYDLFTLEETGTNTVFMLDKFINALPQNLPHDIKKQTVLNIIAASNYSLDTLVSDGNQRLKALNQFMNDYTLNINKVTDSYQEEIKKLSLLINNYNELIKIKESKLTEQKNIIKFEIQRIDTIVDFFQSQD